MIVIGLLIILGFIVWKLILDPSNIPTGEYMFKSVSPDKNYTVKIYQSSGGATTGFAIRGELIENNKLFNEKKNIYWNYPQETATVKWLDNDTVNISGHEIDVKSQIFDFRYD